MSDGFDIQIFNCLNCFNISGPMCPSKCFADGPGLKGGHVNTRYSFSVFTCDENEKIQIVGGASLVIRIVLADTTVIINESVKLNNADRDRTCTRHDVRPSHYHIVCFAVC